MRLSFVLNDDTQLNDIVLALDKGGAGFLAIIDSTHKLIGVVSDGDVRRAFLNGNVDVKSILNTKPYCMPNTSSRAEIISNLKNLHRRHMPLVDRENELVEVFTLDDVDFFRRENIVVVMAGGLGSRLGELTKHTPKPMLHVGGKPMLLHIVESMRDQGFFTFLFCVNYKKEKIKEYFGDGSCFGVKISYIEERERLGTAGALSLIRKLPNDPFIVLNADVITNLDFGELLDFHVEKKNIATMCIKKQKEEIKFGVIKTDGDGFITQISEKPNYEYYINAGIYVIDSEVVKFIPEGEFYDMPMLFKRLMEKDYICNSYVLLGHWMDIGDKEVLNSADKYFTE